MLTHRNLIANIAQVTTAAQIRSDERFIAVLPFFHIYGMQVMMNCGLRSGATVITMPRFDLEEFLRLHQDYGVTRSFVAPPIVVALAKHPLVDKYDMSKLEQAGAEIVRVSCPNFRYALGAYYLIMPSEASSNLAKFDGVFFYTTGILVPAGGPREALTDFVKSGKAFMGTHSATDTFHGVGKVDLLDASAFVEAPLASGVSSGTMWPSRSSFARSSNIWSRGGSMSPISSSISSSS